LYTLLLRLSLPLVLAVLAFRGWRTPQRRMDLKARLGLGLTPDLRRPLWLHGASVGEVQAAAGLIRLLRTRHPTLPLLLTSGTATGQARARLLYGDLLRADESGEVPLSLRQAPFDLPGAVRRFVDATVPCGVVLLETELWPNLVAGIAGCGVPLMMISARVSERSVRRYLHWARGLIGATLRHIAFIGAQTHEDAQRFVRLGARERDVGVLGNLKFDFPLPLDIRTRGAMLRARHAPGRALWVAGSTHAGEEAQVLQAQRSLWREVTELPSITAAAAKIPAPAPLLVIAPRHPERFAAVAAWLQGRGVSFQRRSALVAEAAVAPQTCVLLLDTLGELLSWYAASDVAFVGGSLVPVGGHNLLEPAALGRPVLTGPHSFNAPEAARLLESAEALLRVVDAQSLACAVAALLEDPSRAKAQGARAALAVEANRGAAQRSLEALERLVPELRGG
jgi:3-deoxy-D-manno-octulosonic-acid transferase